MTTALDTVPYLAGALGIGGVGAAVSRRRELIRRWCSWAVIAPVLVVSFTCGATGAVVLAATVAVTALAEYHRLVRLHLAETAVAAVTLLAVIGTAGLSPALVPRLLAAGALAVALVPVVGGDEQEGLRRAAAGVFGVAWLAPLTGLVTLGAVAMPLVVAVSLGDVGAWCAGKALGGPPLSPLSPGKRWTGAAGGALTGLGTLALCGALTPATGIAVALGAPLGDLLESMIKRGTGVKDAGAWLPGFGGLLDRIDSLLVALAIAVILR
jgi:phosphatidate cytidylyltransferase